MLNELHPDDLDVENMEPRFKKDFAWLESQRLSCVNDIRLEERRVQAGSVWANPQRLEALQRRKTKLELLWMVAKKNEHDLEQFKRSQSQ